MEVWFSLAKKHEKSDSFTYNVRSDSGARVLVLAVEDYTGNSALPAYADTTKPNYLDYYGQALADNGVAYDVYDYDAMGRKAPDPLGVLSHYDAVIWETGNDNVTRESATPGVSDAEAWETIMSVRDFVNEGGRVSVSGVNAGRQWDLVEYPTEGLPNSYCDGDLQTTDGGKCNPLSNDFAQYYLGAYLRSDAGGQDQDGNIFPVAGTPGGPLDGLTLQTERRGQRREPGRQRSRDRQLPGHVEHPRQGALPAVRERPGGRLAAVGRRGVRPALRDRSTCTPRLADQGYKRLTRTVDLTGVDRRGAGEPVLLDVVQHGGRLGLRVRRGPHGGPGRLHDAAGRNGHTSDNTGSSCPEGWAELHPIMEHYQTLIENGPGNDDNECLPSTGTPPGAWNAASGNSGGWKNWSIDLSAYRGKQVEVSIVFATDWGTTPVPGAMIDDTTVTAGSNVSQTSFETQGDLGGWTIRGPHAGQPVGERQRLDPVRPDPVRGRRGHGDRLRDDVRLRPRGSGRSGQPRGPDGPHPGPPVAVANG